MDLVDRDHALLSELTRRHLDRALLRAEPMLAGLGTRRFHRLFFAHGEPSTLVARIEPDPKRDTVANRESNPVQDTVSHRESNPVQDTVSHRESNPNRESESPPLWRAEPALEPLRSFLEQAGVPVPASALHLPECGIDLLEDVGDRSLRRVALADRDARYQEACGLVAHLQSLSESADRIPAFGRPYDRSLVDSKAWKWLHWAIPGLLGRNPSPEEADSTRDLFAHIARLAEQAPLRLAHRDFKAENLHLAPNPSDPGERMVMIDLQGAFLAPPEYDLVCLLYDLQVDLEESLIERLFESALPQLPDMPSPELAWERFDALAIARVCKDVAHVVYAAQSRGDGRRWSEIPRGLELIGRAARRRENTFPGARVLTRVIHALTASFKAADPQEQG